MQGDRGPSGARGLQGDRGPSGAKGLKGDSGDSGPSGSRGPTGNCGAQELEGPPGKIVKMGPVGACGGIGAHGEKDDKGDTAGVVQQGPVGSQGSTGPRGSQGAAGKIGPKGDWGAPAVEIDIVAELCKHLLITIAESRGAYAHDAINLMEDIELHDAARIKTIIDKGGRCNASQSDVTGMASLSQTRVNSDVMRMATLSQTRVIMYLTYNMEADIHDFHYFACSWYAKLRLMQKSNIGNAIIQSVIGVVGKKV